MNNEILYNHLKDYSIQEVFSSSWVGFVFEFYSTQETPFMAEDLSKICGKTVAVTSEEKMTPTWNNPVLLKEYEGKNPKYKLTTSPQDFLSVGPMLFGILEWIDQKAKTDKSTGLQVSLSFNGPLQTLHTISNMDPTKLVLKMDEDYLFQRFPERKNSPYSVSVKSLLLTNEFFSTPAAIGTFQTYFLHPSAPYYGIDFTDQLLGELRFNYIGGKDYGKNHKAITEALHYYIISTYQTLNIPGYTAEMGVNLEKIFENYHIIRRIYYDPKWFLENIKDIQVGIDLKRDARIVESFWSKLRDPLTRLMLESGFTKGKFNWDSQEGRFQIKEAKLLGGKITSLDLVDCEVQAIIEDCGLWNTQIKNSRIIFSTLVERNKIEDSILERVRADRNNSISKSWIYNTGEVINCKVNESIVKDAAIGKEAKLDEECTIIEPRHKKVNLPKPVSVEEIRDYKWLTGLNKDRKDKGFQNEFKHKW